MLKILRRHPRGASILVLSFFFMNIMFLVAYALFQVLPAEMHAANRSYTDLKGHYVARAGIEDTMGWLKHQMELYEGDQREENLPDYRPSGTNYPLIEAFTTEANAKRPFTDGDWRYEVEIQPLQDPLSAINILEARMFAIRSTSFLSDRPIRTVDVLVKQKTFAMFSFMDSTPGTPTAMRLTGQPQFKGPVHSNSYFNFNTSGMDWTNALPTFEDVVTHSKTASSAPVNGDGNIWTGGAPYDTGNSYESVFKGGRNDLRLKNHINLPTNTDGLADLAFPGTPPATGGVHISVDGSNRVNGGIYVAGDVDKANLRLDQHGNQKIEFSQVRENGTVTKTQNKNVNCKTVTVTVPPYSVNVNPCLQWSTPSGEAGGVSGPPASPVCTKWTQEIRTTKNQTKCDTIQVEVESANYDPFETHVYEVTEAPVTVTDPDGNPVTAQVGQTLVLNRHRDRTDPAKPWIVDEVQVYDGQINGTIFINGNVGSKNDNSDRVVNDSRREGLWGITKGSAVMDSAGQFVLDSHGKRIYNNKTIVTPLNKEISIGGDLMQFDPNKFEALGGASGLNYEQVVSNKHNWHNVARDPNAADPKDRLSPNNHHVLGVVTRDAWLNGPKKNGNQNPWTGNNTRRQMVGNDGINHVYAVFLSGRTEVDSNGVPLKDADGNPLVSGGFGTWFDRRNSLSEGLGEYKIFGGVIQGTTGNNPGTSSSHTHHWVDGSGSVGYDVGIEFDIEATRQPVFPNFPDFRVVRYYERNARS